MKDVLKVYNIKLITDGPVFIGSGKEIGKKEYVFLKDKNQIGVMEQSKLFILLKEKGLLSEYSKFMMGNSRDDVGVWLKKNHVSENEYKQCQKYLLDCKDAVIESHSKLSVMEFIKDAYGLPYIPGSSVKGMLRTVLLAYDLKNYSRKYQIDKKRIMADSKGKTKNTYLKKEASSIENICFRTISRESTKETDAVNDILSGMIVSDSQPLKIDDLILCQRIERHVDGQERKLNVLREALRPEKEIRFQITMDTSICKITKEYLCNAIEYFGKMYYEYFLRKYSIFSLPDKNAVWLGGGVGFLSKTEVYPMFGEKEGIDITTKIFRDTKVPNQHKHYMDSCWNVSPHICKMTYYQKKRYQMGLCHIVIEEE
ncbi:MAG: type III-A CRISPR-associated RAMP protein Csm5 [Lachnospiraceae bacterium]|nr:type III-A CRISPR-associated RAMP protein Csm5 [Lachnospiraceae bacterium]